MYILRIHSLSLFLFCVIIGPFSSVTVSVDFKSDLCWGRVCGDTNGLPHFVCCPQVGLSQCHHRCRDCCFVSSLYLLFILSQLFTILHSLCNVKMKFDWARYAVAAAIDLGASMIITMTETGLTTRLVCKYRPPVPVVAITSWQHTMQSLTVTKGTLPMVFFFISLFL